MEAYNFKKNAHQYLGILRQILEDGVKMGMDLSPIISKLDSVTKAIDDGVIRIVLLGSFSDGKTSAIAGLLGRLESTMKIDQDESSDELTIYRPNDLKEGYEIVDTPGLFGTKEKEIDGYNVKFSDITKKYISEAHIILYVCDAVNPLKESHSEIIRKITREYNKLDSMVFVINKMDEAYNPKNESSFKEGADIKRESLINKLRHCINLTPEEESKICVVCIAADPKSKGLPYWFENMDDYLALSRIPNLRKAIDCIIEHNNSDKLKDSAVQASVKEMVSSVYQVVGSVNKPVENVLGKVEDSMQDLKLECNSLKEELFSSRKETNQKLDDYKKYLITEINGASSETIRDVIEDKLGVEDGKITFYLFKRDIDLILKECFENNSSNLSPSAIKFENRYNWQEAILKSALGKGAEALGNVKIDATKVKEIRDVIAKNYKFKPHGAKKLGEKATKGLGRAGVALSVLTEAWDWYSAYRDSKKLEELKQSIKNSINHSFRELFESLSDDNYLKTFAPSYIEMCKLLEERNKEVDELRNKLSALTNYKDRIRKWYGEDIEDVEFEEI